MNALIALLREQRDLSGLVAALRSDDALARGLAAEALGAIGDPQAVKLLIAASGDDDDWVRSSVISALAMIGEPAIDALVAALRATKAGVRAAAADALGEIRDARAVEPLIAVLGDDDDSVRSRAVSALVRLSTLAVEALIVALFQKNHKIRMAAADILERLGPDAEAPLRSFIKEHPALASQPDIKRIIERTKNAYYAFFSYSRPPSNIGSLDIAPDLAIFDTAPPSVQLTAFHPKEMRPDDWYTVLAYMYLPLVAQTIFADSERRLDPGVSAATKSRQARVEVARDTQITVVPEMPGCRFNPPSISFRWLEQWHRAEFRVQAHAAIDGFEIDTAVNGHVAFYAESLLIGDIPIFAYLSSEAPGAETPAPTRSESASLYQAIFASYSHNDSEIVDLMSKAYKALGNAFVRDIDSLRSGEEWDDRLLELIEKSDVFQLYWSDAARSSAYVEKEWRHALAQARKGFIRPVFWHKPMADPPRELNGIHFSYYPMS